jgi:hypothetical protein
MPAEANADLLQTDQCHPKISFLHVTLSESDTCTALRMQCGEGLSQFSKRLFGRKERSLRVTN